MYLLTPLPDNLLYLIHKKLIMKKPNFILYLLFLGMFGHLNLSAQDTLTICSGESIFLNAIQFFPTPPQGPAGPAGTPTPIPCTPRLNGISIEPEMNAVASGLMGYTVAPTNTTTYILSSTGSCGGPGSGGFGIEEKTYVVVVNPICGPQPPSVTSNQIFTDYPWLNFIVNPDACGAASIVRYKKGIDNFFLITDTFGEKNLYYENGTFYCQSSPNYDCVAIYNLSEIEETWNCDTSVFRPAPDCSNYSGTFFFENCDDGTEFFFLMTEDGRVLDPYFGEFIDFDPIEGQQVQFDYVPIQVASPCSIAEEAVTLTCLEATPLLDGDVFETYPWLNTLENDFCHFEVYGINSHRYLYIEFDNEAALYYEDGTFYCMDGLNYDCRALYGLSNPLLSWNCGSFSPPNNNPQFSNSAVMDTSLPSKSFNVFPNPTTGFLQVQTSFTPQLSQQLKVYGLDGNLLQEIPIATNKTPIDISSYANGVYYIEWISGADKMIQKVVKQ